MGGRIEVGFVLTNHYRIDLLLIDGIALEAEKNRRASISRRSAVFVDDEVDRSFCLEHTINAGIRILAAIA